MEIALFQPDIPQNTGTILRLGACLGVPVHLIGPIGFDVSAPALRRAGLDYLSRAELVQHVGWTTFVESFEARAGGRLVLFTTHATESHHRFAFRRDDVLLFGRESAGAPTYVHDTADVRLRIPLRSGQRSLNLAMACAMALDTALTTTEGWPD